MRDHIRVLLISPLPGLDPAGGDVTYTQLLLAHPPEGVEFITYEQAMREGTLVERGNRRALRNALQTKDRRTSELFLTAGCNAINRLRRHRVLFNEPFRFFEVRKGAFDLIHLHVFSARFKKTSCPLVVSNAAPLRSLYTNAFHYSELRTAILEKVDTALGRAFGVNVNSYHLPQANRLIVMTEFLRQWYINRSILPSNRIDVVPIYLPPLPVKRVARRPRRVGFIAVNFRIKGGHTLLDAWDIVRSRAPDAELWIVGSEPEIDAEAARQRGITWKGRLPREQLLRDVLPSFDVFAYPTPFDGQPLVVLEAMSAGVPVATSDYQAVPELVGHGTAGLVSPVGDSARLADNILRLLDPEENRHFAEAGARRFNECYSVEAVRPRLLKTYEMALESRRTPAAQLCHS